MNMNRLYAFEMVTSDNEFVNKVTVIKGLRRLTGMGLKDAKEFVEAIQSESECMPTGPIEKRIPVEESMSLADKTDAKKTMEAGGMSAKEIEDYRTNLRTAVKAAAELALKEDEIVVAQDLLEILEYMGK